MCTGPFCTVPIILFRYKSSLNFLNRFSKNTQISNFMKIRPVGAELFHADGQTDMTEPIVAFRNFANASKKLFVLPQSVFTRFVWFIR